MPKTQTIEAIYEQGVFRPLQPINDLAEHERVTLAVTPVLAKFSDEEVEAMLELAFKTYEGLSEAQIQAIEAARLDQEHLFKRPK
jgi:predicted DNA-binding antitoxin AbrB/MazE fold protein